MMNKAFLEDVKKEVGIDAEQWILEKADVRHLFSFYIAQKLWSIEQLLQHQGGR